MGPRSTHRTTSRATALAATTLAVVLLAAACGGDDDGDAKAARTTTTTEASATTSAGGSEGGSSGGATKGSTPFEGYESEVYADPAHWLCRPDTKDLCDDDLDSTVVAADGSLKVEEWSPDPDAPIDCFYVYPTISSDPTPNSDLVPSPDQEGSAARSQVARLGSLCKVYAPVYRQRTLTALVAGLGGGGADQATEEQTRETAYKDVEDSWKQYLANDNHGRGVVLVGHSQGSGILTRLIAEQIDKDAAQRKLFISAYLAGSSVAVPQGKDVGGAFQNVPLCRSEDQTGCVVTWATFRSTSPPPANSFFGRSSAPGTVAGCVNPAAPAGGSAELHSYFTTGESPVGQSAAAPPLVDPRVGKITTPFASTPGLVTGQCVEKDGFSYFEVTIHGDPADPRADDIGGDLTPEWGLHLQDVNLVMGDMLRLVKSQRSAYLGSK